MSENEKLENFRKIQVDWEKARIETTGKKAEFPKYTTQLMNIANQNAQGTRPKIVGQMSDLIQKCPYNSYDGWKKWYLTQKPDAIDNAVNKIMPMINNMKEALGKIDREMVKKWVTDLVIDKTAEGLIIQEIILKEIAKQEGKNWRLAKAYEESQNIDGYIGETPVSIKPITYLSKKSSARDEIYIEVIYYKKQLNIYIFIGYKYQAGAFSTESTFLTCGNPSK